MSGGRLPTRAVVPRSIRLLGTLLAVVAAGLAAPTGAQAHAFLIASNPEPGARLAASPGVMTLSFSEPVVANSERVVVRRADGKRLSLAAPTGRGAVVRQQLPNRLRGVFLVSWRVLADDGHLTVGEFAFSVGRAGKLPALAAGTQPRTPPEQVAFSVLLFVGLALALGGLTSERLVWRRAATEVRAGPIVAGLALCAIAACGQLVLIAGERAGDGLGGGLNVGRLRDATGSRPGLLTVLIVAWIVAAGALVAARRLRWLAVPALLVVVVCVARRSHAGTSGHAWAVPVDALHLAGAALWVGALLQVVLALRACGSGRRAELVAVAIRRYAALALPTVLVILATGPLSAVAELGSPKELLSTGYGRTLVIKGSLVALSLTLALSSRLLALPTNPRVRFGLLRRLTRAEAGALLGVLVAVAALVNAAPPRGSARASTPAPGPPPLSGPTLRVADLAGLATVVGLEASREQLRFTVLRGDDPAPRGTRLKVEARGRGRPADLYPRACGSGCFQIRYRLKPGVTRLAARVDIPKWPHGTARLRIPWPPRPARPDVLRRVVRTMRSLPRVRVTEYVTSGPGASGATTTAADSGRSLLASEPYGPAAVDVRPLDSERPHRSYAFALPGANIWVRITIDRAFRLRRETIVSAGHRIERRFAYPRR